ncbi:hypothetical protein NE237_031349 [Protea cynaroides]|uniref:glutathione transferase n=1 Tax=Protea cynaroides TaxID=273540 RepID=A0A9Q0L111_9MAGN|nr:hypothetical protein NE237_031349 [Protea cynaroides]
MVDEVVLLGFWPSSVGTRVKIALAEKGVEYPYREENLQDKSPLLLEMNPIHKKVPVLIHNGKPILESLIIVQYIDEIWKNKAPLLPSDPFQRAQARFWADYDDKKINHIILKRIILSSKGEEQEKAKKEFIEDLKVLERKLGDKSYFEGDNFGFVVVIFVPFYTWFDVVETFGNLSIEAECPKLIELVERCMQNESVAKSILDSPKIYDYILQMRKELGVD